MIAHVMKEHETDEEVSVNECGAGTESWTNGQIISWAWNYDSDALPLSMLCL